MYRNLDRILENINYHTSLTKEKPETNGSFAKEDILATLGFAKPKTNGSFAKELSLRQIDMLNYHTQITGPSLQEKIISHYSK